MILPQNIQLTRLARGKKILFVEGKDVKLLAKLSKICNRVELFSTGEITVIPIDGFSQHERIIHANWSFTQILGEELKIAVLLDRDYRADEEVQIVLDKLNKEVKFAHILSKKEIENYFLVPTAIEKAIKQKLKERSEENTKIINEFDIHDLLKILTEKLRTETLAQLISHKTKLVQKQGKDPSTIFINKSNEFEKDWENLDYRLNVIGGKSFFTILNDYLQSKLKISITYNQVANYINEKELDNDIKIFLSKLDNFRVNP